MNWLENIFFLQFLNGWIFFIIGIVLLNFPPKKINELYGYRTSGSMKNQNNWTFAQKFSSMLSIKIGLFQIVASFFGVFFENKTEFLHISVGIFSIILTGLLLYYLTESKLKKEFPDII